VGNNIANVNTEGYSRRNVEFVDVTSSSASESSFGLGADIGAVTRRIDEFLSRNVREVKAEKGSAEAREGLLSRAEAPFSVDKTLRHIGFEMSNFFGALNDLQADPGSIPLRSRLIEAGQNFTAAIRLTYNSIASLQREADDRVRVTVGDINSYSQQIASLNSQIAASENGRQQNLGLRDERDRLLTKLAEKISFNTVEAGDGKISVTLANGFSLVSGDNTTQLDFVDIPSFASNNRAIDGGKIGLVVWDSDPTAGVRHVDLTSILAGGSGELSGLLNVRGVSKPADVNAFQAVGDLPSIASRVEAIAQRLLTVFNDTYRPTDGTAIASADLAGAAPPMYGLFTIINPGIVPPIPDANSNNIHDAPDLDSSLRPNFGAVIDFAVTDPTKLALSADENPTAGAVSFSSGNGAIATRLLALRNTSATMTVGNFSATTTLDDLYNDTVSYAGSLAYRAKNELNVTADKETQLGELQSSFSGVSLDEELANLISFQKTFQASSKLIKIGSDLLDQLLQMV